jgi:signal transduction histidine kinase
MSIGGRLNRRLAQIAGVRHRPRRTVRVRLTLLYGALFLLSGAGLLAATYVLFERATEFKKPQLPQIPRTPALHELRPTLQQLFQPQLPAALSNVQHQLTQAQNQLKKSGAQPTLGPHQLVPPQLAQDQHQLAQDQHQLAQAVHQLAQAVHQVALAGSVQAAQRAADSHQLLIDSGIALAIVAVLALLAAWLLSGRMLRPIRTITRTAQRISSASLHERLALDGPQDELKELGDTLDDLFGRLEAAFDAQRRFVANASHELRTPLARQRALIQVALADPEANFASLRAAHLRVLEAEQHLEQLMNALLTLTRGQAELERREPFDLAAITSQALLAREPETAARDLNVRARLATAEATGDRRLVDRLIANLLDNAIRHNTTGGDVEVTTGTRDDHAFLAISNTGPAVRPEEIQRLFEPFQRLDGARTQHNDGHGLGLSIVQAIATAHGAELITHARPQGGLTIEVSFPSTSGTGIRATSSVGLPAAVP